jgi:hypothetical protein
MDLKGINFWVYSQEEVIEINAIAALYEAKGLPRINNSEEV